MHYIIAFSSWMRLQMCQHHNFQKFWEGFASGWKASQAYLEDARLEKARLFILNIFIQIL